MSARLKMPQRVHHTSHWLAKSLPALLVAQLAACSSLTQSLGLRMRLDQIPVTAVSASLVDKHGASGVALGPGESARLVVIAAASDDDHHHHRHCQ
ncbi:MAG: hypothetical protein ACREVO_01515 [Steroidobacteraceae bacterium]